ncbi:MAG: LysM peptidoglycan-binding domain-containing protein [Gemmatimonadaceae bacterium]|nr:LysM peptidoglycan-binding domain-containing protein [Gemmatimonadaceae bacterium]
MKESEGLYRSFNFIKQALLGITAVAFGLLIFGYFIFMRHVDAPKAQAAAERELQGGTLHYGERVEKKARVYQRRPTDYFRGLDGILFATNDRLLFIGTAPSDKLENADAPPVMITQEYPNDTLLSLEHRRLFFLTAHGVAIAHAGYPRGQFGANRGDEKALDDLIDYVSSIHAKQRAEAAKERKLRQDVAAMIREPLYYTVKRGDALSLIATKFEATPDQIKSWNNLPNDRVKIGQRLLVKPPGK